jgi:hypothetical protein
LEYLVSVADIFTLKYPAFPLCPLPVPAASYVIDTLEPATKLIGRVLVPVPTLLAPPTYIPLQVFVFGLATHSRAPVLLLQCKK